MDDSEEFFISLPVTYASNTYKQRQDRPLFAQQSVQQEQSQQSKYKWREQQCQNDEVIDEELLAKMSQLHESLRNKKLLQFELIQAKIMKDQNRKDCITLWEQIQQLKIQSIEVEIENRSNQQDIQQLRREIEQHKAKNRKHLKKIEEINYAIMKTKQKKEQIMQKNMFKENINTENKFISVEKMRLIAENQSKDQIIAQIKLIIAEMKSKIAKKEQQHKQLQDQYQNLLQEIQQEEKKEQKRQKNKVVITQPTTKRNTVDKKTNLSLCHHLQSTQHEVSQSSGSIKQDFKSNRRSEHSCQSLAKPKKVIQNDQKSVVGSTKTKKKDTIQSIR